MRARKRRRKRKSKRKRGEAPFFKARYKFERWKDDDKDVKDTFFFEWIYKLEEASKSAGFLALQNGRNGRQSVRRTHQIVLQRVAIKREKCTCIIHKQQHVISSQYRISSNTNVIRKAFES